MSLYKVQLFICLVFFMALAACALPGPKDTKLTEKDAGATIYVKQGDTVEIALEGNPTTGYTWEQAPGASSLLVQQGEPEFQASSSALGSGGVMTLRFTAVKAGTADVNLIYHRTFEANVPPLQSFHVTIIIDQ